MNNKILFVRQILQNAYFSILYKCISIYLHLKWSNIIKLHLKYFSHSNVTYKFDCPWKGARNIHAKNLNFHKDCAIINFHYTQKFLENSNIFTRIRGGQTNSRASKTNRCHKHFSNMYKKVLNIIKKHRFIFIILWIKTIKVKNQQILIDMSNSTYTWAK